MGLDRAILIEEAGRVLQEPLAKLGFAFEPSPPALWLEYWFEKRARAVSDMYTIIEFQPRGFGRDELFDLTVNLHRRVDRNQLGRGLTAGPAQIWAVRLGSYFWDKQDRSSEQWWHFTSVEQLRQAYDDILGKLVKYGIPFLEDPGSSWYSVMRQRSAGNDV